MTAHQRRETSPGASGGPPDGAVVLLGHGSRDPVGAAEFLTVAQAVRAALPALAVEAGGLEFAGPGGPSIADAFTRGVAPGGRRGLAPPVLLPLRGHPPPGLPQGN